jgi:hypothetical protein
VGTGWGSAGEKKRLIVKHYQLWNRAVCVIICVWINSDPYKPRERIIMTKTQIAMAQTGRTVELGGDRTLEIFEKYGVEYAIIYTPFGVEYHGPLEDLEA